MKKVLSIAITVLITLGISGVVTTVAPIEVSAASDQFIIGQVITDALDVTAPTVPTNLTATAVSTSQIDLSWTASTDDAAVAGYQVFRDLIQIATSTVTTYSDTGLTASTTYAYTVTAFDSSLNISGHSATATATTFPEPVTPGPGNQGDTSGGGGGSVLMLKYLSVSPDIHSALIRFGTNLPVRAEVYWGKTADYELGSTASELYLSEFSVSLMDLTSDTRYYFRIVLVDGHGRKLSIDQQEFRTLSPLDVFAPANVSNFKATPSHEDITLTWNNPKADFDIVRIVKSGKFYPRDPSEGEVIYEGRSEKFVDRDVVQDKMYYYSAFSKDQAGNYSSGSVTDGRLLKPGETSAEPNLFAGIVQLPKELIHELLRKFSILDINFIQDGQKLPVVNDTVEIRGDRNLTISIDYEKVPEILKTIAVTMFDPEDKTKTFSFLLRVNADKTAYEAHIAAVERPGKYQFALAILDYKNQGLASLAGTIFAKVPELVGGSADLVFGLKDFLWLLLLAIVLVLIGYSILRKKRSPIESTPTTGNSVPSA